MSTYNVLPLERLHPSYGNDEYRFVLYPLRKIIYNNYNEFDLTSRFNRLTKKLPPKKNKSNANNNL